MIQTKNPQLRGLNANTCNKGGESVKLCLSESRVNSNIPETPRVKIIQVRLFRLGKQTKSDLNEMTPIADSIPGCGRIKTDIILTCIPGVVLLINNLREILPNWQGSRFVFKKVNK